MNKKKKVLAIVLSTILLAGAVFGIGTAVKKTTGGGRILVVEASNFNYGGYYGSMEEMQGIVTTDFSQDVYVNSSDTIEKVMVGEGDKVREGQTLILYDRTKTSLALQRQELSYEQLKLNIEVAEKNIETLKKISPYSEGGGGGYDPIPPEPIPPEKDAAVYSELNGSSKPYNEKEMGAGTEMEPFRFLCAPDCVVTPAFIRAMKEAAKEGPVYFTLEVREGNKKDGPLIKGFTFEASQLPDVPDAWSGRIFLQEILKESTLVELYGEQSAKTALSGVGDAYNAGDTSGTIGSAENPYRFLVKDGTTLSKSFIDALKAKNNAYFVLESRSGGMLSGSLESMFYQCSGKVNLPGSWTGTVNLSDNEKPVIIVTGEETTPTPEPTVSPTPTETPTPEPTVIPTPTEKSISASIKYTEYQVGEALNLEEFKVLCKMSDGSEKDVTEESSLDTSEFNSSKEGNYQLVVKYKELSCPIDVVVKKSEEPTEERIEAEISKKEYNIGEELEGLKVTVILSDNSSKDVTDKSTTDFDNTKTGEQTFTVTYNGFTAPLTVTVKEGITEIVNSSSKGSFRKISGRFAHTTVLAGPSGSITDGAKYTKVAFGGGGNGGSEGYDLSSVGLISPNAQYSKEELAQARKDAADTLRDYQLDLREAELRLKDARIADEEGVVKAKMDGVIKHVGDPENPTGDGSAFLSVTGSGGQYVRCGISELLLNEIHEGDSVMVTSWENGMAYQAVIKEISPYPDTSGMFGWGGDSVTYYPFTAQVLDESAQLTTNNWVQVSVVKGENSAEEAMSDDGETPENSEGEITEDNQDFHLWKAFIRDEDNHKYVYKEGEDGTLVKQEIKVGKLNGEGYKIISGVSSSDWIAFPYGKGVKEGAKTRHGSPDELYGM